MTDTWSMSDILSEQYFNIGQESRRNIDNDDFIEELKAPIDGCYNIVFSFNEVQEILNKLPLKSGPGPDGLPPHCLKYGGSLVVEAICDIGTSTLEEGLIPEEMKSTWVTPIWKGKDKEDPSDYRPIAITNHIMKVIERIARRQIGLLG